MQKWEYRILIDIGFDPNMRKCAYRQDGMLTNGRTDSFVDVLNDAGQQGWEVLGVSSGEEGTTFVLKRAVR